jgi:hypothetical protein
VLISLLQYASTSACWLHSRLGQRDMACGCTSWVRTSASPQRTGELVPVHLRLREAKPLAQVRLWRCAASGHARLQLLGRCPRDGLGIEGHLTGGIEHLTAPSWQPPSAAVWEAARHRGCRLGGFERTSFVVVVVRRLLTPTLARPRRLRDPMSRAALGWRVVAVKDPLALALSTLCGKPTAARGRKIGTGDDGDDMRTTPFPVPSLRARSVVANTG